MKVAGELGELCPGALFLPLLLLLGNATVVFVEVAAHFLVLRLHVLQVLFARVEVVFPPPAVVSTVAANKQKNSVNDEVSLSLSLSLPGSVNEAGAYNF